MLRNKIRTIVKEEFNKFLMREFMQHSIDWDYLTSLTKEWGYDISIPHKVIDYCKKCLGEPIGEGSSRITFEIDDYTVLKIAKHDFGRDQNFKEDTIYYQSKENPLLPKIYGIDDKGIWLWSEKVIPLEYGDFEKILGIPYSTDHEKEKNIKKPIGYDEYSNIENLNQVGKNELSYQGFLSWWLKLQMQKGRETIYNNPSKISYSPYFEWVEHPWFKNLINLFQYQIPAEFFDDNLGIAMRNNKPTIVVLDTGY